MEAVGDAWGDTYALINTLADTLSDEEAVGNRRGYAHALVDTLADTLAVVEAVGDTPGDTHALVETLTDTASRGLGSRRHSTRFACSGRHKLTR